MKKPLDLSIIFKTKRDSLGNIRRYNVRLLAKGLIIMIPSLMFQKRNHFRIITILVAHFDMKLHQMDMEMTFLNKYLKEEV